MLNPIFGRNFTRSAASKPLPYRMRICLNSVDFPDSPDPSVRQKIKEEEERTEKKKHEPQGSGAREEISRETCVSRACSGVKRAFWLWPTTSRVKFNQRNYSGQRTTD